MARMFYITLTILSVHLLFSISFVSISFGDARSWTEQVESIENLAADDLKTAKTRAKSLRANIQNRIATQKRRATAAEENVEWAEEQSRDAIKDAEADHAKELEYLKQIQDHPDYPDEWVASMQDMMELYSDSAHGDLIRAREYDADAEDARQEKNNAEQTIEVLRQLSSRLDVVLSAEEPLRPPKNKKISNDETETETESPEAYVMPLGDLLGVWSHRGDSKFLVSIYKQFTHDDQLSNNILIETTSSERTWRGYYTPLHEADDPAWEQLPRATLYYTPRADEMRKNVDPAVRTRLVDTVRWRMDLDEMGSRDKPELLMRLRYGTIRYIKHKPESARFFPPDTENPESAGDGAKEGETADNVGPSDAISENSGSGKQKVHEIEKTYRLTKVSSGYLPPDGRIASRGTLRERPAPNNPLQQPECSCESVKLGRIEGKEYTGGFYEKHISWEMKYETDTYYELGLTPKNDIVLPTQDYLDQMCFYFTYPRTYAYLTRQGKRHPCKVTVQLHVPYDNEEGFREAGWELYSIRGFSWMKSSTRNYICNMQATGTSRMPPGEGWIRWRVRSRLNSEICERVPFTVRSAR